MERPAAIQQVVGYAESKIATQSHMRKEPVYVSEEVKEIAWKAQHRLHVKLMTKGKHKGVVVTAVARALLGFLWAIAIQAEVEAEKKNALSKVA
jgi:hypothetical protein